MLEYPNTAVTSVPFPGSDSIRTSPPLCLAYAHADFPGSAGSEEGIGQTADLLRSHPLAVVANHDGQQVGPGSLVHGQCHPGRPGAYRILDYVQYVH